MKCYQKKTKKTTNTILDNLQALRSCSCTQHFNSHFPDKPAFASCLHNFPTSINLRHAKTFHSSPTLSHQVSMTSPLCLRQSTSIVIECLINSVSSSHSKCSNHLHLSPVQFRPQPNMTIDNNHRYSTQCNTTAVYAFTSHFPTSHVDKRQILLEAL